VRASGAHCVRADGTGVLMAPRRKRRTCDFCSEPAEVRVREITDTPEFSLLPDVADGAVCTRHFCQHHFKMYCHDQRSTLTAIRSNPTQGAT
jgi:hypothetical protein